MRKRRGVKNKEEAGWKPKDQRLLMALGGHFGLAPALALLRNCRCWFWSPRKDAVGAKVAGDRSHSITTTTTHPLHLQLLPTTSSNCHTAGGRSQKLLSFLCFLISNQCLLLANANRRPAPGRPGASPLTTPATQSRPQKGSSVWS